LNPKLPSNVRPTFAEIDLPAIRHNLQAIKQRVAPAKVMAVLKANAYGHGLKAVAETALESQVDYFGVALLEEGIKLREYKFSNPVLVFGGFFDHQVEDFLRFDLEFTLFDKGNARVLSKIAKEFGKPTRVHIKVDTGMGRVGVAWQEAVDFAQQVAELSHLEMVGIYTHLASSDERDKTYSTTQLQRFEHVLAELERKNIAIPIKHAANSAAVLDLPNSYLDMVRAGVSMYGYYPSKETSRNLALRPAMAIKSRVIYLKEVAKDAFISYNRTYQTSRKTIIATVPIGYGDGYNRRLSNRGEVLIRGRRFPVVGRVCMDQIMIDVGMDSGIQIGDEVVLLGRQGGEEITIYEMCEKLNTIPYEVTCWVSERVPRVYKTN
jgi:alanine racemase